jgi:hypothetical protein
MQMILNIATLLGGLTALWFFYDKRVTILNWFRLCTRASVNPLSLPDNEFEFIFDKANFFINTLYSPVNSQEKELCLSLTNHGVLRDINGAFKLTGPGKRMLVGSRA